jgi:hypothetical protein
MHKLLLSAEDAGQLIGIGRTKVYELLRVGAIESVVSAGAAASHMTRSPPMWSGCVKKRRATRPPDDGAATGE